MNLADARIRLKQITGRFYPNRAIVDEQLTRSMREINSSLRLLRLEIRLRGNECCDVDQAHRLLYARTVGDCDCCTGQERCSQRIHIYTSEQANRMKDLRNYKESRHCPLNCRNILVTNENVVQSDIGKALDYTLYPVNFTSDYVATFLVEPDAVTDDQQGFFTSSFRAVGRDSAPKIPILQEDIDLEEALIRHAAYEILNNSVLHDAVTTDLQLQNVVAQSNRNFSEYKAHMAKLESKRGIALQYDFTFARNPITEHDMYDTEFRDLEGNRDYGYEENW